MEWPVAFGDGLRKFPHHVLESPFLPDAPFPDASHGIFGKTQSLWDEATVGKLTQHLRDDTTARDVSTPRRYSDHAQDLNRDLDLGVAQESGQSEVRSDGTEAGDYTLTTLGRLSLCPGSPTAWIRRRRPSSRLSCQSFTTTHASTPSCSSPGSRCRGRSRCLLLAL